MNRRRDTKPEKKKQLSESHHMLYSLHSHSKVQVLKTYFRLKIEIPEIPTFINFCQKSESKLKYFYIAPFTNFNFYSNYFKKFYKLFMYRFLLKRKLINHYSSIHQWTWEWSKKVCQCTANQETGDIFQREHSFKQCLLKIIITTIEQARNTDVAQSLDTMRRRRYILKREISVFNAGYAERMRVLMEWTEPLFGGLITPFEIGRALFLSCLGPW